MRKINRHFCLNLLVVAALLSGSFRTAHAQEKAHLTQFANPILGTDFFGHTYPGASLPFAMIHVSPDCNTNGWTYSAGYAYSDHSIIGFSHTHFSGTGMVSGGDILLQPYVSEKLKIVPGAIDHPEEGYRSSFSHAEETAAPGYYSVYLKDNLVRVELTATKRAAMHRYTFPKSLCAKVILDIGHQIGSAPSTGKSRVDILNDRRVEGCKSSDRGTVYFVAEFSKPFEYYGTFDATYKTPESGGSIFPYKSSETGDKIGAFFSFQTNENEQIVVKVAISYVDLDGARKNLKEEMPDFDFDKVRKAANDTWNQQFSRIEISGATDKQKEIFYTALYHSLLAQYISQDVDGRYLGMDSKIHKAEGYDFYGSFSCWDTYRSQHPFLTLIAPDHVNDFLKSIAAKVRDFGWLPAQHFLNVYGEGMVGDHLIPVVVDAYMKGFRDFDYNLVYQAMHKKALELPKPPIPASAARSGLEWYLKLGYTPFDKVTESVPNTLELSYDDWCIAQMAGALGKKADSELFLKRALNYRNVWDGSVEFMRPKRSDGTFLEALNGREQAIDSLGKHTWYRYFDPLLVGRRPSRHYTESNAWQYIWSVQHDVKGLIDLFGSNEKFNAKLDQFFTMDPNITPPKYVGVVGTIGQYVHGNQPSHHVAYLYNYSGEPWKTQERARQVCEQLYKSGPGGLCGNEDMGSLSSWYALSAMGIYAVTPGLPLYNIGSPLFGRVTLSLPGNRQFVIEARNNSAENKYIQSATLNGKPFDRCWISHDEITAGGTLVFEMGPKPSRQWGVKSPPPSLSK
ncbi:MAG: GH92 family glycosyl hydrolase [Marinilabiliales bacterium]|nr:GH92 family glycosyl hydrolase [Marinilabiliales bacterium]